MDVCLRFTGADGAFVEVPCRKARLKRASPFLYNALDNDFLTGKRNSEGQMVLDVANPQFAPEAVQDAVAFLHGGDIPLKRKKDMLGPLDWLGALHTWKPAKDLAVRMGETWRREITLLCDERPLALDYLRKLSELPRPARDAIPGPTYDHLLAVVVKGEQPDDAMDSLADNLRAFDNPPWEQAIGRQMLQWRPSRMLAWLAATTRLTDDAISLALLRAPALLVAKELAGRQALTSAMYDRVITANLRRMALPDFAALACFTSLAKAKHPDLVRMALESQMTAVELDSGVISAKMWADSRANRATLQGPSVILKALYEKVKVQVQPGAPIGNYELYALGGRSGTTLTIAQVQRGAGAERDGATCVPLHRDASHARNALGPNHTFVLLVPSSYQHCPAAAGRA